MRGLVWSHEQREKRRSPVFQDTLRRRRCFWKLLEGSSASTLSKLMDTSKLAECIYMYNHSSKTAVRVVPGSLPWPVMLLLGGFSRNHIFADSKIHKSKYHESALNFQHKVEWTIRGEMGLLENKWFRVQIKRKKPCPAPDWKYVESIAFAVDVRNEMWK